MSAFPSKTFLLGEYAVLAGGPALLLAHEPLFEGSYHEAPQPSAPFPAGSPAERLARELGLDPARFSFHDPHKKRGGFGASGAEFLTVAKLHPQAPSREIDFAWFARELYQSLGESGSGADILVQSLGRTGLLLIRMQERKIEQLPPGVGAEITLFHTGKKLPTHEHLRTLPASAMQKYVPEVEQAVAALRAKSAERLAKAIRGFAQGLAENGFVAPHTSTALLGLANKPGVLAAKGCGAMGSDVLLVLHRGPVACLEGWAREHSLVEVARAAI